MRNPLRSFGLRFSTGHAVLAATVMPVAVLLLHQTSHRRWGIALAAVAVIITFVTFRRRRIGGWIAVLFAWIWRHRKSPEAPSEPVVGATVMPGDHVAVRWEGDVLVGLIELIPRPFTPTVIVDGRAHSDDVVDTLLIEQLLSVHCPDLTADIVSAGYRVADAAPGDLARQYSEAVGSDPAPAHRHTWIVLRADPFGTQRSARRRDVGIPGIIRYLVASTTRIADGLAGHGLDAVCSRSFDDYDHAVDIGFVRERWARIKGANGFTSAYAAPGGPDLWWSAPAQHTITRVRVACGIRPRSTVLLTTPTKAKKPKGFTRMSGTQRAALQGRTLVPDRHVQLPVGSAGILIGQTASRYRVYLPFDDVDASVILGDARTFTQFTVRAAAAGGIVTVTAQFQDFAELIGAQTGPQPRVAWPHATTYLEPHPGVERVVLRPDRLDTPRHRHLPIQPVAMPDEDRYETALPTTAASADRLSRRGSMRHAADAER